MAVKTYSVAKVGNQKISKNFKIKEFQCHDGTDIVIIDDDLVTMIQRIRDHFGVPVHLVSAYRTVTHNRKVGGSQSSYHVRGRACDIVAEDVDPVIVGMYAESIRAGGIGVYAYKNGFVHVDTRTSPYRWLQIRSSGTYETISKIMPTIGRGRTANTVNSVKLVQGKLGVSQSGTFGDLTDTAVKTFQRKKGLTADGLVGSKTWRSMFE